MHGTAELSFGLANQYPRNFCAQTTKTVRGAGGLRRNADDCLLFEDNQNKLASLVSFGGAAVTRSVIDNKTTTTSICWRRTSVLCVCFSFFFVLCVYPKEVPGLAGVRAAEKKF